MEAIVIGAGASGLMAAIQAARQGAKVTLLEGAEKPGKKLAVTGNGRCNLTNRLAVSGTPYHARHPQMADAILRAFPAQDTISFFESMGLLLKIRDQNLLYPYSDQAQAVVEVLLREAARQKVKVKCREKVISVEKDEKGFLVKTEGWQYRADRLILCAGGKAAPATGSDGSGYALAKSLGHTVIPVLPALVPLTVKEEFGKMLEGVRSRSALTLFVDGRRIACETGELQWTSYGISGIVVFQLSSRALRALKAGSQVRIEADLFPDFSMEELEQRIMVRMEKGTFTCEELLGGFFHQKIQKALLKQTNQKPGARAEKQGILRILEVSKHLNLTVTGARSFEQAQVCSGGIPLNEISETMESKKVPGLYLAGEILDVDGPCGGYNLQWAWASGFLAGQNAGKGEL